MNNFHKGKHTHHHHYPTQQELNLQNRESFTVRLEPTVIEVIKKRADERGIPTRSYAAAIIKKYLQSESHLKNLHRILDEIV